MDEPRPPQVTPSSRRISAPGQDLPPSVPDLPTNDDVQDSIDKCTDTLDSMATQSDKRNKKDANLFKKASKALRKVRSLNFDRDTLRQLGPNVKRMKKAVTLNSNQCRQNSIDSRNYERISDAQSIID
ncbi:hypothetical protein ANCCAN_17076 [Ancylostoma caninum]|uniref:Uncharacterized protein n=1 Tax=Ancylostoma caninum TaxID=29170 RepID=A0A368FXV9_ANCCA|nr:hypothetical protein ANCCAN_17076 [Ancylostoma caninum]